MPDNPSIIPHFGLYGEAALTPEPGYVHIEDIETRSSDAGWLIQPHRHGQLFQILCMYDGQVEVQLDAQRLNLTDGWAITIPAGVVHGFRFSPGTRGVVLTIAQPLLEDESYHRSKHFFEPLISAPTTICLFDDAKNSGSVERYMELIASELQHTSAGQTHMLEWLVRATLLALRRVMEMYAPRTFSETSHSQQIARFRRLLDQHYRQHWTVQQYADALNISVATLNRACQSTSNQSVKVIIQNRLLMEAKRRLIYTRENLDQIAYSLGFKDPGYFSRFFKKHQGSAPSDYRRQTWD